MYNECKSCENKTIPLDLAHKNLDEMVFWYAWVTKKNEYVKKNADKENDKKKHKKDY